MTKEPTHNPDGVSIKGCNIIYAPRGRAGEYAPLACNPYSGCGNGCLYCYVPGVLRMDREVFNSEATPRLHFLEMLQRDAQKYHRIGSKEQVMLSFTSDPYHPGKTMFTRYTIEVLIDYGLGFCTLTKGGTRALRDIDLFRPTRDAFATTLTSLSDKFSEKWEPNAALPGDRIEALKEFHRRGIFTWVSLEPTLNVESSLAIMEATHEFVDLYKIGRVNGLKLTETTDWEDYTKRMVRMVRKLKVKYYFKHDLQQYLPKGFQNEMRIKQYH